MSFTPLNSGIEHKVTVGERFLVYRRLDFGKLREKRMIFGPPMPGKKHDNSYDFASTFFDKPLWYPFLGSQKGPPPFWRPPKSQGQSEKVAKK
jgi:hypothetical protein